MGRGTLRSIEGVEAAGYGGGCEGIFVLNMVLEGRAIR